MTCGIYSLDFNGNKYVGQSIDIERRYKEHTKSLLKGKASRKLLQAYNIYGIPKLEILKECNISNLNSTENYYISLYNSYFKGLNTTPTAESTPITGISIYSKAKLELCFKLLIEGILDYLTISSITGIGYYTVVDISTGRRHVWLKEKYPSQYLSLSKNNRSNNILKETKVRSNYKYTINKIFEVFRLLIEGEYSYKDISEVVGIPTGTVSSISKGRQNKKELIEEFGIDIYTKVTGTKRNTKFIDEYPFLKDKAGNIFEITVAAKFAKEHKIDAGALSKLLNNKIKSCKGFTLA